MRNQLFVVGLLGALFAALACGGSSTTPPPDAGTIKEPAVHRATAADCPTDRPATQPPSNPGTCTKDADCTQGKNGRCITLTFQSPAACSYDACGKDSECGSAGVCQCRAKNDGFANVCRPGNCRTDSDCGVVGKGFCSPSAVDIDSSCREGIPAGSFGYFCHTLTDTCSNDADCGASQAACVYDVAKSSWGCRALSCTL